MNIVFAQILSRRSATLGKGAMLAMYIERAGKYVPCEAKEFASEDVFLKALDGKKSRTAPFVVLADSRGRQFSSPEFAAELGAVRDQGVQQVVFAVGPADGWSALGLKRANLTLSFGRITLPHELAAVVLAEQIYRALTILSGHPYHSGH